MLAALARKKNPFFGQNPLHSLKNCLPDFRA